MLIKPIHSDLNWDDDRLSPPVFDIDIQNEKERGNTQDCQSQPETHPSQPSKFTLRPKSNNENDDSGVKNTYVQVIEGSAAFPLDKACPELFGASTV